MIVLTWFLALLPFSFTAGYNVDDEHLYKITWEAENDKMVSSQPLSIRTSRGENFECLVPSAVPMKPELPLNYTTDVKDILNKLVRLQPCTVRVEYYWSYELCHNKYIRQFHEELLQDKSSVLQEYFLGYRLPLSDNDATAVMPPKILIGETSYPYFKTDFVDGTPCDLTNFGRTSSVLYICHEGIEGGIVQVSEIESCKYQIVFATSFLCSNAAYRVAKLSAIPVSCMPQSGSPTKPFAFHEFEEEMKQLKRVGISNLAGIFGDAFKHVQIETEKKDNTIVYRIRAMEKGSPSAPADSPESKQLESAHDVDSEDSPLQPTSDEISHIESPAKSTLQQLRSATNTQLLLFLRGQFCLVGRTAGWWRHELCFAKNVTQFHQNERGKRVQTVLLGEWNREAHEKWASKHSTTKTSTDGRAQLRQYDLYYGHGDFCTDINESRQSIVKIRCDPSAKGIYLSFAERSVCKYSVLVESASFCDMSDEDWAALILVAQQPGVPPA